MAEREPASDRESRLVTERESRLVAEREPASG